MGGGGPVRSIVRMKRTALRSVNRGARGMRGERERDTLGRNRWCLPSSLTGKLDVSGLPRVQADSATLDGRNCGVPPCTLVSGCLEGTTLFAAQICHEAGDSHPELDEATLAGIAIPG